MAQHVAKLSTVQAIKTGYATGTPGGSYSGLSDRFYVIEVHVAGTGAFGSAQWRWTDTWQGDSTVWNASNLPTQNGVNVALNQGLTWRFDAGTFSPQFVLGDTWEFAAVLPYGYLQGLDGTRDQEYRSGAMPAGSTVELRFDLGAAVQPTAAAVLDFNARATDTVSWKAKAASFTDPPDATIPVPFSSAGKSMVLLTTGAFRFWRFCITMGGTSLPYLRWSDLFLGTTLTMTKQFLAGFTRTQARLGSVNLDLLRRGPGPLLLAGELLSVRYARLHAADQARLQTLWDWTRNRINGVQRPFYLVLRDDVPSDFSFYQWGNDFVREHADILDYYHTPIEFAELIRSRVP